MGPDAQAQGRGFLQLILMSIGLAFLLRAIIQWFWSTEIRQLDVDNTSTVEFLGLRIGQTELIVVDRRGRGALGRGPDAALLAAGQADAGALG